MFSAMRPATLQSRPWSQVSLSLISIGSEFLDRGELAEALTSFDAALTALSSSVAVQTLEVAAVSTFFGSERPDPSEAQGVAMGALPDLFEVDECDIGPRVLWTPITVDVLNASDDAILEAIILFNKGLTYHAMGNLLEAKQLYEAVVYTVQSMLTFTFGSPSTTYMALAMRSHNNLGVVSYLERREGVATASFESATQFAKHLSSLSKAYRLEYATGLSNWCHVRWVSGDVGDNLRKSLAEVLQTRISVLSWDHPDVAAAHYNVAVAEYARQNSLSAVSHFSQYLAVANQHAGEKNALDSVPALIFLLLIQNEDKDDHISQDLVRGLRALHDKRQDLGPNSLEVASMLNYVGTLIFHQQDYESALIFFQEELRLEDIKENETECVLDALTSVSVTCNNIGRIFQELGKPHDAISYYYRALEPEYGDMSKLAVAHCKLNSVAANTTTGCLAPLCTASANLYSTVWYNLGLIHDKLGAYGEAIKSFEMSLNLRKVLLGSNHSDIACLMYNIGVLQMEQHRLDEASTSFREALRIRRVAAAGQLNDLHIVKTLEKLASLHKDKGNLRGALEVSQEVLAIQEVSMEYDFVTRMKEMGATLRAVGELHHAAGSLAAAVNVSTESVDKLRVTADLSTHHHIHNLDAKLEPLLVQERISNVEQLVSSMLLLGSLYHEMCEPLQAEAILGEAATIVQQTATASDLCPTYTTPSLFRALQEVTMMLGNCQCAAMA